MITPSNLFDKLGKTHLNVTKSAIASLNSELIKHHCRFGPSAIPCFIKPYFLSAKHSRELQTACGVLSKMHEKLARAYEAYPDLRYFFNISPKAVPYTLMDPGYRRTAVIARPDAFFNGKHFQFLEFNCDSPAGAGYADVEEIILLKHVLLKKIGQNFRFKRMRRLHALLRSLLECYREYGGRYPLPHIAIVDWDRAKTHYEFVITKKYFEKQGCPTRIVDPRNLKFRNNRLETRDGFRIDLVYRRVIFNELLAKKKEVNGLLRAYAFGKVCIVNPLRSRVIANKSMLAFLAHPEFNFLFTNKEKKMRDLWIPWTRRMQFDESVQGGSKDKESVFDRALSDQKKMVLKPANRYGGSGVCLGRDVSSREWKKLLKKILESREEWVLQQFVKTPKMRVPVLKNQRISWPNKNFNMNPFIFSGRYAGSMARLSDSAVINVSAGGGLIPVIVYNKKK